VSTAVHRCADAIILPRSIPRQNRVLFSRLRQERGNRLLHLADRYLGIPLVFLLGALRRRRAAPDSLGSVGLLKTGAIGDLVLLSATVADLRALFPAARLVLFVSGTNRGIAGLIKGVDRIVTLPITRPLAAIRAVREEPLDALLDFGPWPRFDALMTVLSRARFTAGFATDGQYRHFAYDAVVAHSQLHHELENYRALAATLGVPGVADPRLVAPDHCAWSTPRGGYMVFHPWPGGSQAASKRWPASRWVELAQRLERQSDCIFFTGGPGDVVATQAMLSDLRAAGVASVESVAGKLGLEDTAALLAQAELVVSVDTGTAHMAAALGAPLVALFGPTRVERWRPIGPQVTVVQAADPRCGYISLGFETPPVGVDCMDGVSVDAVEAACRSRFDAAAPAPSLNGNQAGPR